MQDAGGRLRGIARSGWTGGGHGQRAVPGTAQCSYAAAPPDVYGSYGGLDTKDFSQFSITML